MQLGQAGPNMEAIATAKGAAYQVFLIIDRVKREDRLLMMIYCQEENLSYKFNNIFWYTIVNLY